MQLTNIQRLTNSMPFGCIWYSMPEDLTDVLLFISPISSSCPALWIKLMKGNHCVRCSITRSPVDPLAPLWFVINCQPSPRGLN